MMMRALAAPLCALLLASCAATPSRPAAPRAIVDVSERSVRVVGGAREVLAAPARTSRYGLGAAPGSRRTPLGEHRVVEKIPAGCPSYGGRIPGPKLVLAGPGCPRSRCIYIHQGSLAYGSDGCVKVSPADALAIYRALPVGAPVEIRP